MIIANIVIISVAITTSLVWEYIINPYLDRKRPKPPKGQKKGNTNE